MSLTDILAYSDNVGTIGVAQDVGEPGPRRLPAPLPLRDADRHRLPRRGLRLAARTGPTGRARRCPRWPWARAWPSRRCSWPPPTAPSPTAASGSRRRWSRRTWTPRGASGRSPRGPHPHHRALDRRRSCATCSRRWWPERHRQGRRRRRLPGGRQDGDGLEGAGRAATAPTAAAPTWPPSRGWCPAQDPQLVVVVMIDEPAGAYYSGGGAAAPAFAADRPAGAGGARHRPGRLARPGAGHGRPAHVDRQGPGRAGGARRTDATTPRVPTTPPTATPRPGRRRGAGAPPPVATAAGGGRPPPRPGAAAGRSPRAPPRPAGRGVAPGPRPGSPPAARQWVTSRRRGARAAPAAGRQLLSRPRRGRRRARRPRRPGRPRDPPGGLRLAARVVPAACSAACPGQQVDGHAFAGDAVAPGAVALLVEHPLGLDVPQIEVSDARRAMAEAAAIFWGDPSTELAVVGVTGTNGKTTVTHMLGAVLSARRLALPGAGHLVGRPDDPRGARPAGALAPAAAPTALGRSPWRSPPTPWRSSGWRARTSRWRCSPTSARTTWTSTATEAAYFAAKARLFEPDRSDPGRGQPRRSPRPPAARCRRHPHRRLLARRRQRRPSRRPGARPHAGRGDGAVGAAARPAQPVQRPGRGDRGPPSWASRPRHRRRPGRRPAGAGPLRGGRRRPALRGGRRLRPHAGRPGEVLEAAREITPPPGRVLVVFGCGGDRDRTKRAPMAGGRLAGRRRRRGHLGQPPHRGSRRRSWSRSEPGSCRPRRAAPAPSSRPTAARPSPPALGEARPGDLVVLAGKGHETTQDLGERVVPFDDRHVAAELLGGVTLGRRAAMTLGRRAAVTGAARDPPPHRGGDRAASSRSSAPTT